MVGSAARFQGLKTVHTLFWHFWSCEVTVTELIVAY